MPGACGSFLLFGIHLSDKKVAECCLSIVLLL